MDIFLFRNKSNNNMKLMKNVLDVGCVNPHTAQIHLINN